jgi:hypothetical protein
MVNPELSLPNLRAKWDAFLSTHSSLSLWSQG